MTEPISLNDLSKFRPLDTSPLAQGSDGSWSVSDVPGLEHILWTLGLLDRPRNAIASALAGKGFMPGLMGETDVSNADLLGVPRAQETDDWPTWLLRGGAHLASNVVGDPLNLLFGTGTIAKGLGLASKVGPGRTLSFVGRGLEAVGAPKVLEWYQGTPLAKLTAHTLAGEKGRQSMAITDKAAREASVVPALQAIDEADKTITRLLTEAGMTPAEQARYRANELWRAHERPGSVPGIDERLVEALRPLSDLSLEAYEAKSALRRAFGQVPAPPIDEEGYNYIARIIGGMGRWLNPHKLDPQALKAHGREIFRFDPEVERRLPEVLPKFGQEIAEWSPSTGQSIVAKAGDLKAQGWKSIDDLTEKQVEKLGLEDLVGQRKWINDAGDIVMQRQATRHEAELLSPYRLWEIDPIEAMGADISHKLEGIYMLRTLKDHMDAGILQPVSALRTGIKQGRFAGRGEKAFDNLGFKSDIPFTGETFRPSQYRQLNIKGFEDWAAPKNIANWLENRFGTIADPTASGVIEKFFRNTKLGQMASAFNRTWKRHMLAMHPGFWAGNAPTNVALAMTHEPKIVREGLSTGNVIWETAKEAVPGLHLTGAQLRNEYRLRGLTDTGYVGQAGEALGRVSNDIDRIPLAEMALSRFGKVGEYATKTMKSGSGLVDWAFEKGMKVTEEPFRIALANSWLRQNVKKGMTPTPEELDAAVRFAKTIMFDAGDLTRAERTAAHFMPFVSWTRNITGQTLSDVATQPHRLASLGRVYDFMGMPFPDRENLPEWQREQGPIAGIFGHRFAPTASGDPAAFLTGRFTPQGSIEQLVSRPSDYLLGMLGPLPKVPLEGFSNWSYFKQRPIDELAGGGLQALTAPLTGAPYATAPQDMLGMRLPAMWDYALTNWTPAGRYLRSADTLLANAIPGVMEDPNQLPMDPVERALWWVTGGKFYPVDEAKNLYHRQMKERREDAAVKAMMNRAMRRGDPGGYEHYLEQLYRVRDRRQNYDLTPVPFR